METTTNEAAVLYLKGLGVEQSFEEALRWYRLAAQRQHPGAQNMLGTIYLTGQGVEVDANEAEHWWRMAAEQGYAAAQYNLGGMYSRNLSTTLSRAEALDWLGRAAEQGHSSATRELAELQAVVAAEARVDAASHETGSEAGDEAAGSGSATL